MYFRGSDGSGGIGVAAVLADIESAGLGILCAGGAAFRIADVPGLPGVVVISEGVNEDIGIGGAVWPFAAVAEGEILYFVLNFAGLVKKHNGVLAFAKAYSGGAENIRHSGIDIAEGRVRIEDYACVRSKGGAFRDSVKRSALVIFVVTELPAGDIYFGGTVVADLHPVVALKGLLGVVGEFADKNVSQKADGHKAREQSREVFVKFHNYSPLWDECEHNYRFYFKYLYILSKKRK